MKRSLIEFVMWIVAALLALGGVALLPVTPVGAVLVFVSGVIVGCLRPRPVDLYEIERPEAEAWAAELREIADRETDRVRAYREWPWPRRPL